MYNTQYSNTGYTLELSHSNMTKCCQNDYNGGSLYLKTFQDFGQAKVLFNHLKLFHNKAEPGGGISADLQGNGNVTLVISIVFSLMDLLRLMVGGLRLYVSISQTAAITIENTKFVDNKAHYGGGILADLRGNGIVRLVISNCFLFNGSAKSRGGGLYLYVAIQTAAITIENTKFVDNKAVSGGGISAHLHGKGNVTLVISNCFLFNGSAKSRGGGLCLYVAIQTAAIRIEKPTLWTIMASVLMR